MTIKTKPATDKYRDGWDRVFGKKETPATEREIILNKRIQTLRAEAAQKRKANPMQNFLEYEKFYDEDWPR
ncbi:MAG: hypothetical protein WC073_11460 [Sterolibacterium sp.]